MKTKIIPFDLETAKKIQAGEIKGKIIDEWGSEYSIITFNGYNTPLPIVAIFHHHSMGDNIFFMDKDGKNADFKLSIELSDNESQFKPFDKVLVRDPDKTELCVSKYRWIPGIFQYKSVNSNLYFVSGKAYKDCILYEGNEYLAGTTDKPMEE